MLNPEALGNKIKSLREQRGFTQSQLANRMMVSRAAVSNWELGNRLPDISMLDRLAFGLDVDVHVLMDELRGPESSPIVILVEDIGMILSSFVRMVGDELPEAEVWGFETVSKALTFVRTNPVSVAFLDIELGGDSGIELARELVAVNPRTNIIFLTSHPEHMQAAFTDHCSGYVLKPLTPEKIRHEIAHLRFPVRGLKT
jgi:transcriptional regulator with XRE-family HTH domain